MKNRCLWVLLLCILPYQVFAQTDMIPKVAVVDVNLVYQSVNANSDAVRKIAALQEKHREEIAKQEAMLTEMKERLAEAEAAGDRSTIRDLNRRISVRENDLQNYKQRANAELRSMNEAMRADPEVLNLIKRAIEIVANRRGYSLVFSTTTAGVVYWSTRIDITKEVIDTVLTLQK
jgi:outer membrane protein